MTIASLNHPKPFLEVRVRKLDPLPGLIALCAGYESGKWRCDQLAKHLLKWLPEFALRESERENLSHFNAVELIGKAAESIYTTRKYKDRGEVGELLLHLAIRQEFKSLPAISKFFFKDTRNGTVKGFDAVHVVIEKNRFELWLGEVKFYEDIGRAIRDVVSELEEHTKKDYLRAEFAAITNKIDDKWPHAKRLKELLHRETSLDKVFQCLCVPVLLTYDSGVIAAHKKVTQEFQAALNKEVERHHKTFCSRKLPQNIKIHLFLVPLKDKNALATAFDKGLRACQEIA